MFAYPFAVIVDLSLPIRASLLAQAVLVQVSGGARVLRIDLQEEGVRDLVLDKALPPVVLGLGSIFGPEERFVSLDLAVVVLNLLHIAVLEAAALAGVEVQEVLPPDVIGDLVGTGQVVSN